MFVYILKNDQNEIYVGQTKDISNRLELHNLRKVKSTKHGCPWTIVHVESFETRGLAMQREKELKTGRGRDWIRANIIK